MTALQAQAEPAAPGARRGAAAGVEAAIDIRGCLKSSDNRCETHAGRALLDLYGPSFGAIVGDFRDRKRSTGPPASP